MPTKIQLRRGTAAQWTAANTILAAGELGYETDTQSFKIGDGTTAWTTLSYASVSTTSLTSAVNSAIAAQKNAPNGIASLDANAKLASGLVTSTVSSATTQTTTSATDALLANMTLTPQSGTYLVMFNCTTSHSANGATTTFSVYSGGTQVTDSIRTLARGNASMTVIGSTTATVTVNGAQAIEIRWSTSTATATATNRTLTVLKVG